MSGFTLIEAVAALAICSTTLVGLLTVRHNLMRQTIRAGQVAKANVVAGELVGDWQVHRLSIEPGERIIGHDETTGMSWRAACEQEQLAEGVFMHLLKVAVFPAGRETTSEPLVSFEAWQPIQGKRQ